MKINLYDIVVSTVEKNNIPSGTIGTVVFVWEEDSRYEIEFIDSDMKTIDCLTLNIDEFRLITKEEIEELDKKKTTE